MDRKATTQDITWFLDIYQSNKLDLDPPYQRRSVWSPGDRKYFLDTILRGYPSPPIFLNKMTNENGLTTYHVVDGKQRLQTIFMFAENKIALASDFGDIRLNNKKWESLPQETKMKFWNYSLTVEIINVIETSIINQVFSRFNKNSRRLEKQELRHARFEGWFINVVETEAEDEMWKLFKVVTDARSRRMKDAQFISELFLIILDGKIVGFDQDYLDEKYSEYDNPSENVPGFLEEDFREEVNEVKKYIQDMENKNNCISKYAKTSANFYVLWALIFLNKSLPEPHILAEKYEAFMTNVEYYIKNNSVEGLAKETSDSVTKYYLNSKGANTDYIQRQARLDVLKKEILGI